MPSPIEATHNTTIHVKDYSRARTFWSQTMGLKEVFTNPTMQIASFQVPNSPPLTIHQFGDFCASGAWMGRPPGTVTGLVFRVRDTFKTVDELKKKGVKITAGPDKMDWGDINAAFADPDGNEFVISQPAQTGPARGA